MNPDKLREEFYNNFPVFADKCQAVNKDVADWWLQKLSETYEVGKLQGMKLRQADVDALEEEAIELSERDSLVFEQVKLLKKDTCDRWHHALPTEYCDSCSNAQSHNTAIDQVLSLNKKENGTS